MRRQFLCIPDVHWPHDPCKTCAVSCQLFWWSLSCLGYFISALFAAGLLLWFCFLVCWALFSKYIPFSSAGGGRGDVNWAVWYLRQSVCVLLRVRFMDWWVGRHRRRDGALHRERVKYVWYIYKFTILVLYIYNITFKKNLLFSFLCIVAKSTIYI